MVLGMTNFPSPSPRGTATNILVDILEISADIDESIGKGIC